MSASLGPIRIKWRKGRRWDAMGGPGHDGACPSHFGGDVNRMVGMWAGFLGRTTLCAFGAHRGLALRSEAHLSSIPQVRSGLQQLNPGGARSVVPGLVLDAVRSVHIVIVAMKHDPDEMAKGSALGCDVNRMVGKWAGFFAWNSLCAFCEERGTLTQSVQTKRLPVRGSAVIPFSPQSHRYSHAHPSLYWNFSSRFSSHAVCLGSG